MSKGAVSPTGAVAGRGGIQELTMFLPGSFMPARQPQSFDETYNCYSFVLQDKMHLEGSDKIFLPPSALDTLARLHIDYPMLFKITCKSSGRHTHCGVLEFSAAEGSCYLPWWMMQNLFLEEGGFLQVTNVSLPKASFVKFRPQSVDFLEISNPRAVLERALRSFSCVTVGDHICIPYNSKFYHLEVREVKPADAACIIETDCNVDFEAPVGYVEPERRAAGSGVMESKGGSNRSTPEPQLRTLSSKGGYVDEGADAKDEGKGKAFVGAGQRLDGKPAKGGASGSSPVSAPGASLNGTPANAPLRSSPLAGRTLTGKPVGSTIGASAAGGGYTMGGGGGQTLGGSGGGAGAQQRTGAPALGGKYSTKKQFASFGGSGSSLK